LLLAYYFSSLITLVSLYMRINKFICMFNISHFHVHCIRAQSLKYKTEWVSNWWAWASLVNMSSQRLCASLLYAWLWFWWPFLSDNLVCTNRRVSVVCKYNKNYLNLYEIGLLCDRIILYLYFLLDIIAFPLKLHDSTFTRYYSFLTKIVWSYFFTWHYSFGFGFGFKDSTAVSILFVFLISYKYV
jgi:hypothetical protein